MPRDPRDVLTRPSPPPDTTVRYGGLPEHVADVRWPTSAAGTPPPAALVVVVHGGFWRSGFDRQHTGPQCAALAQAGYAVAAVEYRRTGQEGGGWPGTLDDLAAAVDAVPALVAEAADRAGVAVDPDRVVLVGHSAGGHLAVWAASRPDAPADARPPAGVVALSGVVDLALAHDLALDDDGAGSAVDVLLGGGPRDVPERYAAADPMALAPARCPVVLLHGTDDEVVPVALSRSYASRAREVGADVHLVELPGTGHFEPIDPESSAWPAVLDAVAALLGR